MSFPTFTTGEVLSASDMNAVGLWLVKKVSIGTGVTTVDVTSCFNSSYDNYLVNVLNVDATNDCAVECRMLNGNTVNASNWKGNTFYITTGAGGGLTNAAFNNSAFIECGGVSAAYNNGFMFEVIQPNVATQTVVNYRAFDSGSFRFGGGSLLNTTVYNGLQIKPSAGTITGGAICVYGIRN